MKLAVTKRKWLSKVFGAVFCLVLLANPAGAASAAPSAPYNLTLAWSRNSSRTPAVSGYSVYYGTASKKYTGSIAVGNVTTHLVSGLTNGVTYFFAITAYNTNGLESGFSKEFSYVSKASKALSAQSLSLANETSAVPVVPTAQVRAASSSSSAMLATTPVPPAVQIHMASNRQSVLTVSGQASHTYDIMATENFADWTVIGTVTLDAGGSQDFTDTNPANFPQRFYRINETQP